MLWSMGSRRVRHDLTIKQQLCLPQLATGVPQILKAIKPLKMLRCAQAMIVFPGPVFLQDSGLVLWLSCAFCSFRQYQSQFSSDCTIIYLSSVFSDSHDNQCGIVMD